ncbi:transglutaminase N-terminal domain-containing protein [Sphingomonas sp. KR1UV-12]|uniref:Transglutaminase N-terminal domain-containing protein n=1 Tax=Sphingomonas aurea TaxID=3063994 RepID=A0ABT9EI36_9SPHN|nr:transglutaminase N-terminal domain-containing protein [Sphingomonas sp. KR1UV-12]MDP1026624.1 transglutaminase N-terminal domain-containing protein [Sphingomonas sp. KR1UV-12]
MRLSIHHRTAYRFTAPQARLVQMLRLTPQNSHDQTVARWRIDVDCDALLREGRDGWGNAVTMLYAEGPLDGIEIAITGEVLTSHSDGVLHGVHETLPPPVFLRATPATAPDPAIAAWAAEMASGVPMLTALHRINAGVHARFAPDAGRPDPELTAGKAWLRESATARDAAQIFAVAARSIGAPARYVSGYRCLAREARATPHGWAEAHVDGLGWVGFDPDTGLSPEEEHVRVAVALDAVGAAPVAGSRLGEGDERLDVEVRVSEA